LVDHAGRHQSGETREIHRGLRLTSTFQDTPVAVKQREDVSEAREVLRARSADRRRR